MLAAARALGRWLANWEAQSLPLPGDALEQLRRERMRAHLSHDDLRHSARRIS
jgi:hypothetical protein